MGSTRKHRSVTTASYFLSSSKWQSTQERNELVLVFILCLKQNARVWSLKIVGRRWHHHKIEVPFLIAEILQQTQQWKTTINLPRMNMIIFSCLGMLFLFVQTQLWFSTVSYTWNIVRLAGLMPSPHARPGEQRSGEKSRISWAWIP